MAEVATSTIFETAVRLNVTDRLTHFAAKMPDALAVACPHHSSPRHRREKRGSSATIYATITFAELDADASAIARGLLEWGVSPSARLALLVRPGIEFISLVFGLLRAGMVIVLVDPGLGRRNLLRCLQEAEPEGFVAIPTAQAARVLWRRKFPRARWNVTVGRRWFWGGTTLDEIRAFGQRSLLTPRSSLPVTQPDDPAAIIFTSGSTGPPKGVLYTHRMFDAQVSEIQSMYGIESGGTDLACFPLFALFNAAMGVTTVLPDMDFSRPAAADPKKLLAAANDWQVTQAFASPAVWRVVSDHCETMGERIPTLRQAFSCGAPVPAEVLRKTLACGAPGAKMHTPYGATECLPVSTIEASEVLNETAQRTDEGAGVCVGRKFDSIEWRVIRITDGPIASIDDAEELPPGEIGELLVRGAQASPCYVTQTEHNAQAKVRERAGASSPPRLMSPSHGGEDAPARFEMDSVAHPWHRMGDAGYLDEFGRFWYCGRKSQRVQTTNGTMFTEPVEAIFTRQPFVKRCALVGVGPRLAQTPVIVYELSLPRTLYPDPKAPDAPCMPSQIAEAMPAELAKRGSLNPLTAEVRHFLHNKRLPVDVRHNSKINREQLATWATKQLANRSPQPPAPGP
jgi:acyl-CoA synthetase (AMP-forming)/AMP-acid ligase II